MVGWNKSKILFCDLSTGDLALRLIYGDVSIVDQVLRLIVSVFSLSMTLLIKLFGSVDSIDKL